MHTGQGVGTSPARRHVLKSQSQFPHDDIADEGPPLLAALCTSGRDDPAYRGRSDHGPDGLLIGGPRGESNPLQRLQGFTFCAISASTPEGERKRHVVSKARVAEQRGPSEPVMVGRFLCPRKPANSGRKRRAA